MSSFKRKFVGDKDFYKKLLSVALPIVIQNGVTNGVNFLDNAMVGRLGTEMMSGVSIVNQLMMVYGISIFGVISGASIFSTQYYGQGNHEGVRNTFRFKMIVGIVVTLIWMGVFAVFKNGLISLYLHDDGSGDLGLTLTAATSYILVMLVGLIPYTISQVYSSTLRETGQTIVPMIASSVAVGMNLVLNYVFIFGHFGAPKMGVVGAAIATVISRFIEMGIDIIWTHGHADRHPFIKGVYKSLRVPMDLVKQATVKGLPLLFNETLWSVSQALLALFYSTRGLTSVAAFNISNTVGNLFNIVFIALGNAIAIIVGQKLGAGELDEAYDTSRKLLFVSIVAGLATGFVMYVLAPVFPLIYNTSDEIRLIAKELLMTNACYYVVYSFYNATYFTLRSGGKTGITFIFDSFSLAVVSLPLCYVLTHFTKLPLVTCFALVQGVEAIKCIIGGILIKKKIWLVDLVKEL